MGKAFTVNRTKAQRELKLMEHRFKIPFNKPFVAGKELYYISQAVMEGHLSGNGPFSRQCQNWLESRLGCKKALLTHSCTGALEMAAILCDVKDGDEIIMPSFTFVSTANAFVLRGAKVVFVDIKQDTLNLDERLIEEAITPKTKVIVPVHYAGISCGMDRILEIAQKNRLWVIEDAAQGFLSTYKKNYLGTLGNMGCLSFHETKNIISGEGGALLINDDSLAERAEIVWEKGTNRRQFFEGQTDKYTWVDLGSSFLPSELVGAFLYAQFEQAEKIIAARARKFFRYCELLLPLEENGCFRLPHVGNDSYGNGHIFYIITRSFEERKRLIAYLKERGISAIFHYIPLHSSPAGIRYGQVSGSMDITNRISERILRLPLYYEMTDEDQDLVVKSLHSFYK